MNSFSAISIERPPTSPLLRSIAIRTSESRGVGPQFDRVHGDLVLPHEAPIDATSATPSTDESW